MQAVKPLIWTEGQFLTQQHFQYWDEWSKLQQSTLMQCLLPYGYGLLNCELDEQALHEQTCRIHRLIWRKPSGELLQYDASCMAALEVTLTSKPNQTVYLNLPQNALCQDLSGYDTLNNTAGYAASYQLMPDQYDEKRQQEVLLGVPNIKLSLAPLSAQHYAAWPLLQVNQEVGTHFSLDHTFFPVAMMVSASSSHQAWLKNAINMLVNKSRELKQNLERSNDESLLIQWATIEESLLKLKSIQQHGVGTPHQVFELIELCTMKLSCAQQKMTAHDMYEHENQSQCLMKALSKLESALQYQVKTIQTYEMQHKNEQYFVQDALSADHINGYSWYMGIKLHQNDSEAVTQLKRQLKLGTVTTLPQMIANALPGISVQHVSRPPRQVRVREKYEYFKIDDSSPYWKNVEEEANFMLYLPKVFHGDVITLDIVKE